MRIVVTGMVGLSKKEYLEKVCRFARENGQDVELRSVGDMMYAEAPDRLASIMSARSVFAVRNTTGMSLV